MNITRETKMGSIALSLCFVLFLALPLINDVPQSAIRLHVIANSDSAYDQALKLKVRDSILDAMSPTLADAPDKVRARETLLGNGEALQSAADSVLKQAGDPYGARLYFGDFSFPDRQYGDKIYPAGDYEAIRVVLGDGEGKNWWCVMFPPLCLIDLNGAKTPDSPAGKVRFESAIVNLLNAKKASPTTATTAK